MDSRQNLVLCMVLVIITSSALLNPTSADLIDDVCHKVPLYSHLCLSTLRSDPRSVHTADAKVLAEITMDHALSKAKETVVVLDELLRTTQEHWLRTELTACAGMYKATVDEYLPKAIHSIKMHDVSQAVSSLTSASDAAVDCEDRFEGAPIRVSPIKDRNDALSQLCIIASSII